MPEAGVPLRTGIRDARPIWRQEGRHRLLMSVLEDNLLALEDKMSAPCSSWNAPGSALVADVLGRNGGLRQRLRLRVHGESMLPSLWPGDVVEIESCSLEDVRPGEIVLARRDGRLFLHRLVAPTPDGFLLCGDSVPGPDPLFPPQALLGRLVRRRGLGESRLGAKWSRALGILLDRCGVARRLALRLHSLRRRASGEFQDSARTAEPGIL